MAFFGSWPGPGNQDPSGRPQDPWLNLYLYNSASFKWFKTQNEQITTSVLSKMFLNALFGAKPTQRQWKKWIS